MPNAQALPSTADERLAKIRKTSLATQKKSRDSSRGLAFFCVFIVPLLSTSHRGHRQRLYVLTKDCREHLRQPVPARLTPNDGI